MIERAGKSPQRGSGPRTGPTNATAASWARCKGMPAYESFFPYFPLMGVFGLPSAETHTSKGLTDARIVMSLMTLLVSGVALGMLARVATTRRSASPRSCWRCPRARCSSPPGVTTCRSWRCCCSAWRRCSGDNNLAPASASGSRRR